VYYVHNLRKYIIKGTTALLNSCC